MINNESSQVTHGYLPIARGNRLDDCTTVHRVVSTAWYLLLKYDVPTP